MFVRFPYFAFEHCIFPSNDLSPPSFFFRIGMAQSRSNFDEPMAFRTSWILYFILAKVLPSSRWKCIYPKNHWTLLYWLFFSRVLGSPKHQFWHPMSLNTPLKYRYQKWWFGTWFSFSKMCFSGSTLVFGGVYIHGAIFCCPGWRVGAFSGSSSLLSTFKDLLLYESEQVRGLGWCLGSLY